MFPMWGNVFPYIVGVLWQGLGPQVLTVGDLRSRAFCGSLSPIRFLYISMNLGTQIYRDCFLPWETGLSINATCMIKRFDYDHH